MGILSPSFLVNNIDTIGQIISVMLLIIYDDYVSGKIIFPYIDKFKFFLYHTLKIKVKPKYRIIPKYLAESLATLMFIFYFFMGYWVLSEFILVPILVRLKGIILIITIGFFILMSWLLNNKMLRKKYFYY